MKNIYIKLAIVVSAAEQYIPVSCCCTANVVLRAVGTVLGGKYLCKVSSSSDSSTYILSSAAVVFSDLHFTDHTCFFMH